MLRSLGISLWSNNSLMVPLTFSMLSRASFKSLSAFLISFELMSDSLIFPAMFVPAPMTPKLIPVTNKGVAAPSVKIVATPPMMVRTPPTTPTEVPPIRVILPSLHASSSLSAAARRLWTASFTLRNITSALSFNFSASFMSECDWSTLRSMTTLANSLRNSPILSCTIRIPAE